MFLYYCIENYSCRIFKTFHDDTLLCCNKLILVYK